VTGKATSDGEWARGWPVVLSAGVGMMLANLHVGVGGALMQPLSEQFGWSRAEISTGLMILCGCLLALGPVVGMVIDRVGPHRVAVLGLALYAAAFANLGFAGPGILSWYLAWLLLGVAYPMVCAVVWTMGVGRCFQVHRGVAFSLALSGTGLATMLAPVIIAAALPVIGWRGALFVLAGLIFAGLPLVWRYFRPDEVVPAQAPGSDPAGRLITGMTTPEILRSLRFWVLCLCVLLVSTAVGTLVMHFQPVMRDAGMSAAATAGYYSLVGIALAIGRLGVGFLLDRFPSRYVAAVCFVFPGIACLLLTGFTGTPAVAIAAAVMIGLSYGAEGDIIAFITAEYFGLRRYGFAYAILLGLYSFMFGLSSVIAGAVFDAMGSYDAVFRFLVATLVISGLVVAFLGRPPVFAASGEGELNQGAGSRSR